MLQGGGRNCGDEDFAVFGCPYCHNVYLMEYEVDTVFIDAHDWRREESGGNWYYCPQFDIEGWLCPALFKYFEKAPAALYGRAEPKT